MNWQRLQKDGSWRILEKAIPLHSGDFTTEDPKSISGEFRPPGKLVIADKTYNLANYKSSTIHQRFHLRSIVFRRNFPGIPEEEPLNKLLRKRKRTPESAIVLTAFGTYEFHYEEPMESRFDPARVYTVHPWDHSSRSFTPEKLYNYLLTVWLYKLQRSHLLPSYCVKSTEAILNELTELEQNWEPEY